MSRTRNYIAMTDMKLEKCIWSLSRKSGSAYWRCVDQGSGDPEGDLTICLDEALDREIITIKEFEAAQERFKRAKDPLKVRR